MYGKSCKEDSFQFSRCLPNTFAYGRMHFTSHILADGGGVVVLQLVNSNCKSQRSTPRPRTALLMCLKKYSAIGNSAIGNYVVLYSKLTLKTVLLEVSYGKND